jgi:hypothetical protein
MGGFKGGWGDEVGRSFRRVAYIYVFFFREKTFFFNKKHFFQKKKEYLQ